MGWPIVTVAKAGLAVTEVANGLPVSVAGNGYGLAVTVVPSGGMPVTGSGGSGGTIPSLPGSLSSFAFKYEADNLATLFQTNIGTTPVVNDGDVVGTWNDAAASAFNVVTLANDTTRPIWHNVGGSNWVEFDGVNDGLENTAIAPGLYAAGASSFTIAVRGVLGIIGYLLAETSSSSANPVYAYKQNGTTAGAMSTFLRNSVPTIVLNDVPVLAAAFNSTDKVISLVDTGTALLFYVDDVPKLGLSYARAGTVTVNQFGLGSFYRAGVQSSWWPGRIYNAIALKRQFTRVELARTVAYQAFKQGGRSIVKPAAIFGNNSAFFLPGTFIDCGTILRFEKTVPWSLSARVKLSTTLPATACLVMGNVTTATAFPGIDFLFINSAGQAHVRLISNITTPSYIGVKGTTNLCDGNPHTILTTYDGSGVAAGVKIYVDGVLETMTVESDTLGANLIFNGNEQTYVGNQKNHLDFALNGELALLRVYSDTKNSTFASTYANGQAPTDAGNNCLLAYNFQAGAGLIEADLSPSGLNGTLSTEMVWYR